MLPDWHHRASADLEVAFNATRHGTAMRHGWAVTLACAVFVCLIAVPLSAQQPPRTWTWVDPETNPPEPMQYRTFRSEHAGGDVSYLIYLPPGYDATERRYPTIYWLHGLNGRQAGGARLARRADAAAKAGEGPEVILVSVNGLRAGMYCDSKDGKRPVESVIVKDLVAHVDATYRTIPRREARAVAGMSMGGFGALRLGFKFPDVFGVVSSYAAALHTEKTLRERRRGIFDEVFGDEEYGRAQTPWAIVRENAERIKGRSTVRLIIGTADGLYGWNQEYRALLEELEIQHQYIFIPGVGHNYRELEERTAWQTAAFYRQAFADVTAEGR